MEARVKMLILPIPNAVVSYLGLIHKFSEFYLSLTKSEAIGMGVGNLFFFLKTNK